MATEETSTFIEHEVKDVNRTKHGLRFSCRASEGAIPDGQVVRAERDVEIDVLCKYSVALTFILPNPFLLHGLCIR